MSHFRASLFSLLALPAAALAQPITIDDPGFEETSLTNCAFIGGFGPTSGWTINQSGNAGAWRPSTCWDIVAPQGSQVAYSNGGVIRQVLTENAIPGATYTMTVMIGNRNHPCCPFQITTLDLLAGEERIGRREVQLGEAPPRGRFLTYRWVVTAPSNLQTGQPLTIEMRAASAQVDFDAVTLERGGGCAADFNQDGFLDFFDYADYVNCFENAECAPGTSADFNGDGFADFFDYADFVAAFESGC